MKPQDNPPSDLPPGGEIDLLALAKTIWKGRKTVFICLVTFTLFGIFIALTSPVEYTAKTVIVPQMQSKATGLGGLGSLAAMAGFNLDALQGSLAAMAGFNLDALQGGASELSPTVYPQIVKSTPFQRKIMHTPLTWDGQPEQFSLLYFYDSIYKPTAVEWLKKFTVGLPGTILTWLRGKSGQNVVQPGGEEALLAITREERDMCKFLDKRLLISLNTKEGYITLAVVAPEALAAAQMAQKAQQLLQNQVIEYKINRARQNLVFVQSLLKEKETDFLNAQSRLATYRDKNLNLNSALAKTEEEKLQSDYTLTFSVYNEVAKQLENAKIKVKEDTPTFSIIEPVSIPAEKSKPKKPVIIAIWFFLGGVIGLCWIFGRDYVHSVSTKWGLRE